jgi:hypothetical protein
MEKTRYQFEYARLPMMLFLAYCLTVTVVAGSVAKRIHHWIQKKRAKNEKIVHTVTSEWVFPRLVSARCINIIFLDWGKKRILCFRLLFFSSRLRFPTTDRKNPRLDLRQPGPSEQCSNVSTLECQVKDNSMNDFSLLTHLAPLSTHFLI